MNKKIKKKWTARLRSGKVRQGMGALAKPDLNKHLRRCCLGVLCDILGVESKTKPDDDRKTYFFEGTESGAWLPDALETKLRLPRSIQCKLGHMNDGRCQDRKNFSQIADWIDANL